MDPFSLLGVAPGASPAEVTAAYRRLAKRWHPDRGSGVAGARRMAEVNAAYEVLRAGAWQREPPRERPRQPPPARVGGWLPEPVRRALGRELLRALGDAEPVTLVTPAATWASPRTLLAVTDRRLLWLLDDAPTHRVRSLAFRDINAIDHSLRRPRRRVAVLRVRTRLGRTLSFAELRPSTAAAIVGHVADRRAPRTG